MRAFQLTSYDGPAGLVPATVPEPEPAPGLVVVEVHAIGVNFPDLLMTQGKYQHHPDLPVVPGCELAGIVHKAPADSRWQPGDRVAAFVWEGAFAEYATVPEHHLMEVPDDLDLAAAAAMVVNYHTVHFGLARRGRVMPDETVLVMGAAGGIGTAGLQVARGLGARVLAGVADDNQGRIATDAGADEVVMLTEGFAGTVLEMTGGRGVDVVLDPLGDWLFNEALRALAPEGRILVVGFAAGGIPTLKVNRLLLRNITAVGVAWGAFLDVDPELMATQSTSLLRMVVDGVVRPQIGATFPFNDLPLALQALADGKIPGKGIVRHD